MSQKKPHPRAARLERAVRASEPDAESVSVYFVRRADSAHEKRGWYARTVTETHPLASARISKAYLGPSYRTALAGLR